MRINKSLCTSVFSHVSKQIFGQLENIQENQIIFAAILFQSLRGVLIRKKQENMSMKPQRTQNNYLQTHVSNITMIVFFLYVFWIFIRLNYRKESEEGIGSLRTGVTTVVSHHWETESESSEREANATSLAHYFIFSFCLQ